jgi:hypothetical protein
MFMCTYWNVVVYVHIEMWLFSTFYLAKAPFAYGSKIAMKCHFWTPQNPAWTSRFSALLKLFKISGFCRESKAQKRDATKLMDIAALLCWFGKYITSWGLIAVFPMVFLSSIYRAYCNLYGSRSRDLWTRFWYFLERSRAPCFFL